MSTEALLTSFSSILFMWGSQSEERLLIGKMAEKGKGGGVQRACKVTLLIYNRSSLKFCPC